MQRVKRVFKNLVSNRGKLFDSLIVNFLKFLPDKVYLSLRFRAQMGYWMNWASPTTFSEKIQWLKIYNRKPIYTIMVDKYSVKDYVGKLIGNEYIIPTIGLWDTPEAIEWEQLPNSFVLKTTHGGGSVGVIICRDKTQIDKESASQILNSSLKSDIYHSYREWPYKNVPRKIIAEKFMSSLNIEESAGLTDYKFYCFNGEPKYCQVIRDRNTKETIDFYDMNWQHQDFVGLNPNVHNGTNPVPRPMRLKEMIEICRKLSTNIPFLRVDLYDIDGKVYFGEMTFYPASGFGQFRPIEWQNILGDMIELPVCNNQN